MGQELGGILAVVGVQLILLHRNDVDFLLLEQRRVVVEHGRAVPARDGVVVAAGARIPRFRVVAEPVDQAGPHILQGKALVLARAHIVVQFGEVPLLDIALEILVVDHDDVRRVAAAQGAGQIGGIARGLGNQRHLDILMGIVERLDGVRQQRLVGVVHLRPEGHLFLSLLLPVAAAVAGREATQQHRAHGDCQALHRAFFHVILSLSIWGFIPFARVGFLAGPPRRRSGPR